MRILHLSDTHLGTERAARGAPRGWRRAEDHALAMEAALRPAIEEQVDLVLHTGDVFDKAAPPGDAIASAVELLHRASRRVPTVIMPGNHDRRGLKALLMELPGLHICDEPTRLVFGDLALGVVPYYREADAWAHAAEEAVGGGVDLVLAHQSFHGSSVPGFRFRAGTHRETVGREHLPRGVRLVATGHLHPRQTVRLGDVPVVHTGSTERTSFSEQHETKSCTIWSFDRRVTWTWMDLPTRPMRTVHELSDLDGVAPGTLVSLAQDVRTVEHEEAVLASGAWLTGRPAMAPRDRRPPPERQSRMFGV